MGHPASHNQPFIVQTLLKHFRGSTDRILLAALFQKLTGTLVGPAQAALLITCLTAEQQGYWYTFTGLLAIAGYAEMGLGQVITQLAAHEWFLQPKQNGNQPKRLQGLYRISLLWSIAIAILVPLICLPLGWLVIGTEKASVNHATVSWHGPWLLVTAASFGILILAFQNSFLEGCQYMVSANIRRSVESLVGLCGSAVLLLSGYGLWALGVSQILVVTVGISWILIRHGKLLRCMITGCLYNHSFSWRKEVWPLQWRYAATWVTGIAVAGLFTPVIFKMVDASAAGRFGFSWSLAAVISGYAQVWITSRIPLFAGLNASKKWIEYQHLFKKCTLLALISYVIGAIALLGAAFIIRHFGFGLSHRIIPETGLLFLLIGQFATMLVTFVTILARSFKEEPFVKLAWANAMLTSVLLLPLVYFWKETGAALAYAISQVITALLSITIFVAYWRRTTPHSNG